MTPDSALVDRVVASPNHGERPDGRVPDLIILHYTGMVSGEAAIERLTDTASGAAEWSRTKVSIHVRERVTQAQARRRT